LTAKISPSFKVILKIPDEKWWEPGGSLESPSLPQDVLGRLLGSSSVSSFLDVHALMVSTCLSERMRQN
jgi:hypothetical protein